MLHNSVFYFDLIKKYVTLFGVLFHDLQIIRTDANNVSKTIKVPLEYGPKDKMLARLTQDPNLDRPQAMITLPAMSFEMGDIEYDSVRKVGTVHRLGRANTANKDVANYQYNPVPYDIEFKLYIAAKNVEDGTKVIEQILPFFTPDWTLTALLVPEMNIKQDISIVFQKISVDDSYEGDFKTRRAIVWTLGFKLKGWMYGPVKTSKIIKFANTTFYNVSSTYDTAADGVGLTHPAERVTVQPGLTANGQPTSSSAATVPYADITATDDYGYITIVDTDPQSN
jgi:hypothetical protein